LPVLAVKGKTMRQIPKDIREGKAAVEALKALIDNLDTAFISAAKNRARKHKTNFEFPDCGVFHKADPSQYQWDDIILRWQLCLLFAEWTAGMIGQKSAEGHCQTPGHIPCKKMSKRFLKTMLRTFKKDLETLVKQIGRVERLVLKHTDGFDKPSKAVAHDLGLREEPP
jgi:hypothetical protein